MQRFSGFQVLRTVRSTFIITLGSIPALLQVASLRLKGCPGIAALPVKVTHAVRPPHDAGLAHPWNQVSASLSLSLSLFLQDAEVAAWICSRRAIATARSSMSAKPNGWLAQGTDVPGPRLLHKRSTQAFGCMRHVTSIGPERRQAPTGTGLASPVPVELDERAAPLGKVFCE